MSERVAVVGLGLIGGSIAAAVRQAGSRVCGFDQSPDHARRALELGLIDATEPELEAAVAQTNLVVLAVSNDAVIDLVDRIDRSAPPAATVLDTASVKAPIVGAMGVLPGAHRFLGGHPLAGKETSGPEAADPALFRGRPFVLCPTARTEAAALKRAFRFGESLGSHPLLMEAEEHDTTVARTSHLPQALSTVLATLLEPDDRRLAGPGLQDMTRLAHSNPSMWRTIFLANGPNLVHSARAFVRQLETLIEAIEVGNGDAVEAMIAKGGAAAAGLKKGAAP